MANGVLEGPYNINYMPGVFGMNHGQMPGVNQNINGLPYGRLPYSSSRSNSEADHASDSVSDSLKKQGSREWVSSAFGS